MLKYTYSKLHSSKTLFLASDTGHTDNMSRNTQIGTKHSQITSVCSQLRHYVPMVQPPLGREAMLLYYYGFIWKFKKQYSDGYFKKKKNTVLELRYAARLNASISRIT